MKASTFFGLLFFSISIGCAVDLICRMIAEHVTIIIH